MIMSDWRDLLVEILWAILLLSGMVASFIYVVFL